MFYLQIENVNMYFLSMKFKDRLVNKSCMKVGNRIKSL